MEIIFNVLIILLLAFIAFYPLYAHRFNKKWHFRNKLYSVYRRIADTEFLREEYKATREGFRREYDRLNELIDAANVRTKAEKEKEDPDKTIIEQLDKLKKRYEPDVDQLKKQMDNIDLLIEGPVPEGSPQQPVNAVLDNLRSVVVRLKEVIKSL